MAVLLLLFEDLSRLPFCSCEGFVPLATVFEWLQDRMLCTEPRESTLVLIHWLGFLGFGSESLDGQTNARCCNQSVVLQCVEQYLHLGQLLQPR